jgi:prepilin-type N-terminal cleavage/methylation domain-containing protein
MKTSHHSAFSLIELLVALSVVALVAAIIVPQFMTVQKQAQDTVAQQMASELNHTFANWQASGGQLTFPAVTSDVLTVLSSATPVPVGVLATANDGGTSSNIRATLPAGTVIPPNSSVVTLGSGSNIVMVAFDPNAQQFIATTTDGNGNPIDPQTGAPMTLVASVNNQGAYFSPNGPQPQTGVPVYQYGVCPESTSSDPQWYAVTYTAGQYGGPVVANQAGYYTTSYTMQHDPNNGLQATPDFL